MGSWTPVPAAGGPCQNHEFVNEISQSREKKRSDFRATRKLHEPSRLPSPMFATLSRRSSRARQAYICSSCLHNALTHAPPGPLQAGGAERARRVVSFYSTTTSSDAQPPNEAIEPVEIPKTEVAEDGKAAHVADSAEGQGPGKRKKPKGRRLSSSKSALIALRQSLALAAEQEAVPGYRVQTTQSVKGEASATRIPRGARRLELARMVKEKKKKGAETGEAKKDTVKAPKTKKATSKTSKAKKQGDEEKSEGLSSIVRRLVSENSSPDFRRLVDLKSTDMTEKGEEKPSTGDQEAQGVVRNADEKTTIHWLRTRTDPTNPDSSAVRAFLSKYPEIEKKVREFQEHASTTQGEEIPGVPSDNLLKRGLSTRRTLVGLIQTGELSGEEKTVIMKLLKASISTRGSHATLNLTTVETPSAAVAKRDSTTRVAAPSAAPVKGRVRPTTKAPTTKAPMQEAKLGPISAARGTTKHEIETIEANELQLTPIDKEPPEVPSLAYGLERVLFNPGVYHLQDPRSRVFNFDPYLQTIMPVSEFDFNALKQYITSSRDQTLLSKAKEEEKKYTGSTSSMTAALGHFHFLLSQWRPITTGILSQMFPVEFNTFTALQRGPVAVFLRWRDGTYAIDADKEYDNSNILMMLGKSMEKLLTLSTDDFEKYRKANSDQISEEQRNESEPFHYTTMGDFLLRSQLDAHDPRLPGTGMFDLKTRAVVSVRMDTSAFEEGRGYQIRGRHGEWESFEREYYDMIRSAFLKYSLQVRMGRMDGIFVAFHNTERIFGFQYISLPEMDYALHGTDNTAIGDSEFKLSLELLNRVLDRATAKFPKQSLRLHFETRDGVTPFMYIFAEPVAEKDIEKIQATNKLKIEEFESEVLGVATSKLTEEQKEAEWAKLRAKVEEEMQQDELGIENAEEAKTQSALDGLVMQEQHKAEELLATTTFEDGEENEEDDEEDEVLIEQLEDGDEETLEEEEGQDEETLEEDEGHDEESEGAVVEDGDENLEGNDLDETLADDAAESDESLEEQGLKEQDTAEENLSDDLQETEESESLQERDVEEQTSAEEIVAQDLEEADRLKIIGDEEETFDEESNRADPEPPNIKNDIAKLTAAGTLSGSTIKEAASKKASESTDRDATEATDGDATKATDGDATEATRTPLLAMTLVIRNKVNNKYVKRPESLRDHEKWDVEYVLSEVQKPESAHKLYEQTKARRYRALTKSVDPTENAWNNTFIGSIKKMNEKGRVWRDKQDKIEKRLPVKTLVVKGGNQMRTKDRDVWHQGKEE
ncbi:mitochondrial protein Pet127-domain-containing protein [Hyaloscypha finlandica]|nr:mitochondrial protein Pet127-domain-containing protein [Hyaloscypha finlandica]